MLNTLDLIAIAVCVLMLLWIGVRGLTTGDLFETRFDARTGVLAAAVIGLAWFAFVGGQIIAGGTLLQVTLDLSLAIAVSGGVILAYTTMGGLKAVIYSDVFQIIVLMIGILGLMVPIGLYQVGGWSAMAANFEASDTTRSMLDGAPSIAAVMSSADSCLIGPVAIFTNDIYRKRIDSAASRQQADSS